MHRLQSAHDVRSSVYSVSTRLKTYDLFTEQYSEQEFQGGLGRTRKAIQNRGRRRIRSIQFEYSVSALSRFIAHFLPLANEYKIRLGYFYLFFESHKMSDKCMEIRKCENSNYLQLQYCFTLEASAKHFAFFHEHKNIIYDFMNCSYRQSSRGGP